MVSTPEGDRAIDQLKVGDIVWSRPEKGGKPFAAAILATHIRTDQPIYRLKLKAYVKTEMPIARPSWLRRATHFMCLQSVTFSRPLI